MKSWLKRKQLKPMVGMAASSLNITNSMMAMKTQRVKIGTCVLLLPLHHPVHVAEDCAVIDLATKGRLILSIGVGYQPHDFDAFEIPVAERATRTEEALEVMRRCWAGKRFSYAGKHFQY